MPTIQSSILLLYLCRHRSICTSYVQYCAINKINTQICISNKSGCIEPTALCAAFKGTRATCMDLFYFKQNSYFYILGCKNFIY